MIYYAFQVHAPRIKTKPAMTAYAKAIVEAANRNMVKYEEAHGLEPDTLLVDPHAPAEVETWFGEAMQVMRHAMPAGMLGVCKI